MRRATQIISLVLMVALFVQSCAITLGGSAVESLSTNAAERQEAEDIAGAGALGIFAAVLWLVGAAFVMSRPKVATWVYGAASLCCLSGAAAGFTDLWIWMVVSLAFTAMSWRGIGEKVRQEEEERARYRADVQAATEAALASQEREREPGQDSDPDREREMQ
jgi:uncharacterized membrane protein